jgi:hypothetical protein
VLEVLERSPDLEHVLHRLAVEATPEKRE